MNIFKKYLHSVRYNYAYLVGLLLFIMFSLPILLGITSLGFGSHKQYRKTYILLEKYGPESKFKIESKLSFYCDKATCIDFSKKSLSD